MKENPAAVMDSKSSPDNLLAYHGRPSLLYPALRADVDDPPGFPRRLASGLGTAKFLCGACLALLGGMAAYVRARSAGTYGGIWSGLFAIFSGLCVILAARKHDPAKPNSSLLVALLVLSVLGFFNTGLLAAFTAMDLVAEVYMEDLSGGLVWRGVENASPFAVQVLLLTTATADSLLSLACCVISGREVCCCGRPTPAAAAAAAVGRRDRLIRWLGSQQPPPPLGLLPAVKLVPSASRPAPSRSKTPSTLRVFPPAPDPSESLPSSSGGSGGGSADLPLVKADELGKESRRRDRKRDHLRQAPRRDERAVEQVNDARITVPVVDEKYFALDKKLSEDFIDRTWNFR